MEINLHQLTLFLSTFLSYNVLQSCAFRSDYGYVESTGSYYKFHTDIATWHDANSKCQSEGAILFHPESEDEFMQALRAANVEMDRGWNIMSGFSDLRRNGFYETVDGRPVSEVYNKWNKEQPHKGASRGYHCGGFMVSGLTLYVRDCDLDGVFMCKYKPINETLTTTTEKVNTVLGAFRSDYGYVESTGSYYKFHIDGANWHDANSRCQSEGAILFHPENKDELEQALKLAPSDYTGWNINTGFSDLGKDGFYETVDGRPFSQVHNDWVGWDPEDGVSKGYHCGAVRVDLKKNFLTDCDYPRSFICKYKPIDETVTTTTEKVNTVLGAIRSDYSYVESTGSYYKFHIEFANWYEATSTCQSEGAILFHPENKYELEQALRLAPHSYTGWNIYSGFSDLEKDGIYGTVDGRPISEVFNDWMGGYPEGGMSNGDHCGHIAVQLKIFLHNCYHSTSFICKYKPIDETVTTTTEKVNAVHDNSVNTSAAILERPSEELQSQAAVQTAALERIAEAMQRQATALESLAGAFPAYSSALHMLTAPKMKVIVTQEDNGQLNVRSEQ